LRWQQRLTTLRFPVPDFRASKPPGPRLILRDFLRLAAIVLPTSTVAFSLSFVFRDGDRAPTDLRGLRVAGNVASLWDDIFPQCWCALPILGCHCCHCKVQRAESKEARHVNQTKPPAKSQSGRDKTRASVQGSDCCQPRGTCLLNRLFSLAGHVNDVNKAKP
jgi:hypothetical protein